VIVCFCSRAGKLISSKTLQSGKLQSVLRIAVSLKTEAKVLMEAFCSWHQLKKNPLIAKQTEAKTSYKCHKTSNQQSRNPLRSCVATHDGVINNPILLQ
jgi:hypothetical protein